MKIRCSPWMVFDCGSQLHTFRGITANSLCVFRQNLHIEASLPVVYHRALRCVSVCLCLGINLCALTQHNLGRLSKPGVNLPEWKGFMCFHGILCAYLGVFHPSKICIKIGGWNRPIVTYHLCFGSLPV